MKTLFPIALLLVFFAFLIPQAQGQFVENGSFESNTACPNCQGGGSSTTNGLDIVDNWSYNSTHGTPDYFNSCAVSPFPAGCPNVGVPNNLCNQVVNTALPAADGNGYVGITGVTGGREYVQTKLKNELTAGDTYKLSFYVRQAPDAMLTFSTVGAAFSTSAVSASVLNLTPIITGTGMNPNSWTLVTGTFTATGNEKYLTIGFFGSQASIAIPAPAIGDRSFLTFDRAYYLIDDVKLCEDPLVPLDASFTTSLFCKNGKIAINSDATNRYCNHLFELYETTGPFTSDPYLVMPPVISGTRDNVYFFVPYEAGKYYVIKHTVWDACHGAIEVRELIQLDDFQGSITSPSPICEGLPVIINSTDIIPDAGTPWTLTVEGLVPGSPVSINPHTYYGCGIPGPINLSSPAASGLYDSPLSSCPTKLTPDGNPYNFSCDDYCSYYRVTISYIRCGIPFTSEVEVHILCAPLLSCSANPFMPCLNDPVIYTAINPTTGAPDPFVTYNWYNGFGQLIGTGSPLGPRNYNPFEGTIHVEAISSAGCVSHCKAGTIMCTGGNGGGTYQGGGKKRVASTSAASIQIFPNPVSRQLSMNYDLSGYQQAQAIVYNLTGQVVLTQALITTQSQTKMDVSQLEAGAYILRVTADGVSITQEKVIVSR